MDDYVIVPKFRSRLLKGGSILHRENFSLIDKVLNIKRERERLYGFDKEFNNSPVKD